MRALSASARGCKSFVLQLSMTALTCFRDLPASAQVSDRHEATGSVSRCLGHGQVWMVSRHKWQDHPVLLYGQSRFEAMPRSPVIHAAAVGEPRFVEELVTRIAKPEEFAQPDPSRFIVQDWRGAFNLSWSSRFLMRSARCDVSGRRDHRWHTQHRADRCGCPPPEHCSCHPRLRVFS